MDSTVRNCISVNTKIAAIKVTVGLLLGEVTIHSDSRAAILSFNSLMKHSRLVKEG